MRSSLLVILTSLGLLLPMDRGAIVAADTLDHTYLMNYLGTDGQLYPVQNTADWAIRRGQILEGMQLVMGDLLDRSSLPPPDVIYGESVDKGTYTQTHISYLSEGDNNRVPAYLLLPKNLPAGPLPAILALHQTGPGKSEVAGETGWANMAYGKELAERGYIVLAPDYPSFGEYSCNFSESIYPSGTMKGIVDNMRAIDVLQSLPQVNPDRIGVLGHSLGGHNSLFVGAFDERIKVVVSSCGWTPFHYDDLPSWTGPNYMPRIATVYNNDPDLVPFEFYEVVAALAPRPFFSNSPLYDSDFDYHGVQDAEPKDREIYDLFGVADNLQIRYPAGYHDFSPAMRLEAYAFLDQALGDPGDLNRDGFVGAADLDIVRAHWGQNVTLGNWLLGDPSCDGHVGAADLDIIRAHWGEGTPPGPVPEPSALVLLALGGLTLVINGVAAHPSRSSRKDS